MLLRLTHVFPPRPAPTWSGARLTCCAKLLPYCTITLVCCTPSLASSQATCTSICAARRCRMRPRRLARRRTRRAWLTVAGHGMWTTLLSQVLYPSRLLPLLWLHLGRPLPGLAQVWTAAWLVCSPFSSQTTAQCWAPLKTAPLALPPSMLSPRTLSLPVWLAWQLRASASHHDVRLASPPTQLLVSWQRNTPPCRRSTPPWRSRHMVEGQTRVSWQLQRSLVPITKVFVRLHGAWQQLPIRSCSWSRPSPGDLRRMWSSPGSQNAPSGHRAPPLLLAHELRWSPPLRLRCSAAAVVQQVVTREIAG